MAKVNSGSKADGYQQSETGTVLSILMGGKSIGRISTLTTQIQYGTTGVWGIGDYLPYEYVFLQYSGQVTAEGIRLRTGNFVDSGIISLGDDILQQGDITITVTDTYTQSVLAAYQHCTPVSYNLQVRAGQLVTEQAVFNFTEATQAAS